MKRDYQMYVYCSNYVYNGSFIMFRQKKTKFIVIASLEVLSEDSTNTTSITRLKIDYFISIKFQAQYGRDLIMSNLRQMKLKLLSYR